MLPAVFIGHGSPENALQDNEYTRNWKKLARALPKPEAILCISAHWLKEGTAVTGIEKPATIHDFYGFGDELYKIRYDANGSPEMADKIKNIVKTVRVGIDLEWGLDHGAWSVLANMYPKADVPVVQLSLDYYLPPEKLYAIGKELKPLREIGVLIIGSGNLVHNLTRMDPDSGPYSWATEFDSFVKKNLDKRNDKALITYMEQNTATLAHPSNEHYIPLLHVLGASIGEKPQFFNEDIFAGSVGMRCAVFGLDRPL